jgi:hypothetical protein
MNLNRLARRFHKPVIGYWSSRLFADRSVTSIYMHYPAVDELSVCSGLIRRDA